jgi:hypothetical protein
MKRFAIAGALICALAAQAYILPGVSILRRMADGRDELQLFTLKIEGNLSFFGEATKESGGALGIASDRGDVQTEAAIYLKLPGRCRVEASSLESQKVAAAVDSNGKKRVEGGEIPGLAVAVAQICPLLAFRSSSDNEGRDAVMRYLGTLKIDFRKTSLARFGGHVVYVLGDAAEGQPQFWVYKLPTGSNSNDNFLPARIRFTDAAGTAWDVRFYDYSSPATGEWFPRTVEVFKGSDPVLKFTGVRADAKSKIDDKLF